MLFNQLYVSMQSFLQNNKLHCVTFSILDLNDFVALMIFLQNIF